jgi:two-component system nitrate/nitrite response regulator NarL
MQTILGIRAGLYRAGVKHLIESSFKGTVVQEAGSAQDLSDGLERAGTVDVLVVELGLPGLGGASGIPAVRAKSSAPIIVIGDRSLSGELNQALRNGAQIAVPASAEADALISAIRKVAGQLAGNAEARAENGTGAALHQPCSVSKESEAPAYKGLGKLTRRQAQVLDLLAEGYSNRQIASTLGMAEGTVRVHVAAILRALEVRNRTQAALMVLRAKH